MALSKIEYPLSAGISAAPRRFDRRNYKWVAFADTKEEAKRYAVRLREQGYRARVIGIKPIGEADYRIYGYR